MYISWLLANILFALALFAVSPTCADDDDTEYTCEIEGDVKACDDDDKYKVVCDLKMQHNGDHVVLDGTIDIREAMDDQTQIQIDIDKQMDKGPPSQVFTVKMDVCEAMKDKDMPWYDVFESMKLEKCPIEAGSYPIENLRLNMDAISGFLNQEYVGEYDCILKTAKEPDMTSCHSLKLAILEKSDK